MFDIRQREHYCLLNAPSAMSATPRIDRPFDSDEQLIALVELVEQKTLPYERWTQRAHLGVATTYLAKFQFDEALDRIRNTIQGYNHSRNDSVGYHETLTVFFMRLVARELRHSISASLAESVNDLAARFPFSVVTFYYSKDLLGSDLARSEFEAPDIRPMDS